MHAIRAFSITRPLNASGLRKAWPERCMVLKSHYMVVISSSRKNCALALSPHFDIDCRITIFAFKLLANYEGNYECHDKITVVTIY